MKIKCTNFKTLIAGLVFFGATSAWASDDMFKVAVIENATATKGLIAGNIEASIKTLKRKVRTENTFENNMSLCVAYLKSDHIQNSESACTAAIKQVHWMGESSNNAKYLKSLSYNNRGVSRYLSKNIAGAIADFTKAESINANAITSNNLKLVNQYLAKEDDAELSLLAD